MDYTYQQVVSECVRVPTTKTESEKVANTVATFLNKAEMKIPAIKVESGKVANTVATFLNKVEMKIPATKDESGKVASPEKVANTVATFLNEGSDGFRRPNLRRRKFGMKTRILF
jgi:CRISPR/Cas system CMR-associated protein Cmr5 small subunit